MPIDGLGQRPHDEDLLRLQRGMSEERKNIEDAFRIEIAELEQRHSDELDAAVKKLQQEKVRLVPL